MASYSLDGEINNISYVCQEKSATAPFFLLLARALGVILDESRAGAPILNDQGVPFALKSYIDMANLTPGQKDLIHRTIARDYLGALETLTRLLRTQYKEG